MSGEKGKEECETKEGHRQQERTPPTEWREGTSEQPHTTRMTRMRDVHFSLETTFVDVTTGMTTMYS
jgi:hypothetical protein